MFDLFFGSADMKKEKGPDFFAKFVPTWMKTSENLLKRRGGKFFVANTVRYLYMLQQDLESTQGVCQFVMQLTYADIAVAYVMDQIKSMPFDDIPGQEMRQGLATQYPLLEDLRVRVSEVPAIKAYLAKRPKTAL